jgi:putative serine protease PepD
MPSRWPAAVGGGLVSAVVVSAVLLGTGVAGNDNSQPASTMPATTTPVSISANDTKGDLARAVYAAASPSVASVRTSEGSGTGFLVDSNGTMVTNAHVVGNNKQVQVRFNDKGQYHDAQVLSVDASTDLAALKIDPSDAQGIRPLALADSDNVQVGDSAIAIGYPLGLDRTATAGIVSGLERSIESPNGFSIDKVIQTDAPVNPGNSGGPLLNAKGQVIGVNSQIATAAGGGEGNVGIAFAIPANTVKSVLPDLENGAAPKHAYLGLTTTSTASADGARVEQTTSGGPAERAGLQPGDVVKKVDDTTIASADDVAQAISDKQPGDKVKVTVERNGHEQTVDVTLGQRPEQVPSQEQSPALP